MSDPLSFLYMSVASVLGDKSNFLLARIQKALSDFFADEGRERTVLPLKAGHYRLASETSSKWHFAGGPMMAQH